MSCIHRAAPGALGPGPLKATQSDRSATWPGALVTARVIVRTEHNAVTVPSIAVQNGQNGPYVFVIKPDNAVAIAQVKTGPTDGDVTVLTSGVSVGDNIVLPDNRASPPEPRSWRSRPTLRPSAPQ